MRCMLMLGRSPLKSTQFSGGGIEAPRPNRGGLGCHSGAPLGHAHPDSPADNLGSEALLVLRDRIPVHAFLAPVS